MKTAQLDKLYSKLTPYEQAGLFFEAAVRQDNAELEVIVNSLERRPYRALRPEFTKRKEGLFMLAWTYGIEYWRNREMMIRAIAVYHKTGSEAALYVGLNAADELTGMEAALVDVCKRTSINIDAVKTVAQCKDEIIFDNEEFVNPEIVKQYTELFMSMVS